MAKGQSLQAVFCAAIIVTATMNIVANIIISNVVIII